MGIDFRLMLPERVNASMSYGGFNDFRNRIAGEFGTTTEELYHENKISLSAKKPTEGPWAKIPDGLFPLMNHSDCDGQLDAEQCAIVYPALEDVAAKWPVTEFYRQIAEELVVAMRKAAMCGGRLEFR